MSNCSPEMPNYRCVRGFFFDGPLIAITHNSARVGNREKELSQGVKIWDANFNLHSQFCTLNRFVGLQLHQTGIFCHHFKKAEGR